MAIYSSAAIALAAARSSCASGVPDNIERHLVGRFGFGSTGRSPHVDPDVWFDNQLRAAAATPGYAGVPGLQRAFTSLTLEPKDVRSWLIARGNEWKLDAMYELEASTLMLQTWSGAQLYEAVVDVFSNILNASNLRVDIWCARSGYDYSVIRANAMGSYSDMLLASSKHPAMLIYLDNARSVKAAPNENYGRELLELHTVTPSAGYTQADVVNSARVLTGRVVNFANTSYIYNYNQRWTGPIQVLDFADPNSDIRKGEEVGDRYIRYLASHPSTARNIAQRLCQRFVSDTPSDQLVQDVADVYLKNDSQLVPVLQAIVRSSEFWSSAGLKTRRPAENLVASLRISGARPQSDLNKAGLALGELSGKVGQRPLAWPPPNGYPDVGPVWQTAGNLTAQWLTHFQLIAGELEDIVRLPRPSSYLGATAPRTVHEALNALSQRLLGRAVTSSDEGAVLSYLGESRTRNYRGSRLASQLGEVTALLLHGPRHALR